MTDTSVSHIYTVDFRIEGRGVDPSAISAQLKRSPTYARQADERRSKTKRFENGLWSYAGDSSAANDRKEWPSLELGLLHIIEQLSPVHGAIRILATEFDVYWWCGNFQSSFNGGPTFSLALLEKLAWFGIPLSLENYFIDASQVRD